jgi:histone-lysine N-methyltransferase SETMAR
MLQTLCGDEALSRSTVFECLNDFKTGVRTFRMIQKSGRPSTSPNADTIANVREMVTRDRLWALRMMADEPNINKKRIHQILREDLRKREICAKFVPHRLTDEQKEWRLTSCQDFIQTRQDNPSFLDCIFSLLR